MSYGFSFTEPVYKEIKFKSKTYWALKFLKTRPPHTITIHTDDYGNITKFVQKTNNLTEMDLDPSKFMLFSYRPKFNNHYGKPDITEGVYSSVFYKKID